jgi:hypothetical protein
LDFTVGHTHVAPSSLDDALGRPIGREEARDCFGCHAPEAVEGDTLRLEGFSPGVTCESCPGHRGSDPRVSCVACHDPHRDVGREAVAYDSKCLACHVSDAKEAKTKERAANACPVAKTECVKCHMPKVEIPGMHARFTDHWIRTVRPGDAVPH